MTNEEINGLPDNVRKYIHDLQTRCDPAGDVQRMASLEEQVGALTAKCEELEKTVDLVMEHDSNLIDYLKG